MRVCVVTPSKSSSASAGVRIRYDRLRAAAPYADITIAPIGTFDSKPTLVHDAYVFVKTYEANAYILAHRLRQMGKLVGVDIFDNYFTQTWDSRLTHQRAWLATMGEIVDFVLCSTQPLERALRELIPGKPVAVIDDPSPAFDTRSIVDSLNKKQAEVLATRSLRVLWFGVGDNPYFPVGLRDLVAFGGELDRLNRDGWSAELKVLTNTRSLSVAGLNLIKRLPIPFMIEEWTPQAEERELAESQICFLPVNGQEFSRMKSLNRAVTALVAGCQVLSGGYPLYEPLSSFIYSSASAILRDLENRSLVVREETVPALTKRLDELASPRRAAEAFFSFLEDIRASTSRNASSESGLASRDVSAKSSVRSFITGFAQDLGIIHGAKPDQGVHNLIRALGGISVKGPFCQKDWNFHVRFELPRTGSLRILIAETLADLVAPDLRERLDPYDQTFRVLMQSELRLAGVRLLRARSLVKDVTAAPRLTTDVLTACRRLFPGVTFYAGERSPLLSQSVELGA